MVTAPYFAPVSNSALFRGEGGSGRGQSTTKALILRNFSNTPLQLQSIFLNNTCFFFIDAKRQGCCDEIKSESEVAVWPGAYSYLNYIFASLGFACGLAQFWQSWECFFSVSFPSIFKRRIVLYRLYVNFRCSSAFQCISVNYRYLRF